MKKSSSRDVYLHGNKPDVLDDDIVLIGETILKKKDFVLATHVQPDGDAIGSILGLGLFLKKLGKNVFLSLSQSSKPIKHKNYLPIPPQYAFLPGTDLFSDYFKCPDETECFIALDCASFERIGNLGSCAKNAGTFINIDHHQDNDKFAHINFVDGNSPATTEIVYRLIKSMNEKINKDIAICLYTGLVTDTGRFQYSNTDKRAFQMALELLGYGVSPSEIFHNIYENVSFSYLKLLGKVLQNIKFDSGIIYAVISQHDLISIGARVEETENLIDVLRSVGQAKIAVILKETGDGRWKVSLRSKNEIDVSKVAKQFGGGGHHNAAGYVSEKDKKDTIEFMLKALRSL